MRQPWPEVFAHLVHTFSHRFHIAQIAELDPTQALIETLPGEPILKVLEPVGKLFETFYRVSHYRSVIE